MAGNNEWLEYNLKPLLNSVIAALGDVKALLQTMTATAGSILTEGADVTLVAGDNTIVTYTNTESSQVFVSIVIGTTSKTGLWKLELPEGAGVKEIQKRGQHQSPNFVNPFIPGFPLPVGKTVTLVFEPSSASGTAKGFIAAYKSS